MRSGSYWASLWAPMRDWRNAFIVMLGIWILFRGFIDGFGWPTGAVATGALVAAGLLAAVTVHWFSWRRKLASVLSDRLR